MQKAGQISPSTIDSQHKAAPQHKPDYIPSENSIVSERIVPPEPRLKPHVQASKKNKNLPSAVTRINSPDTRKRTEQSFGKRRDSQSKAINVAKTVVKKQRLPPNRVLTIKTQRLNKPSVKPDQRNVDVIIPKTFPLSLKSPWQQLTNTTPNFKLNSLDYPVLSTENQAKYRIPKNQQPSPWKSIPSAARDLSIVDYPPLARR